MITSREKLLAEAEALLDWFTDTRNLGPLDACAVMAVAIVAALHEDREAGRSFVRFLARDLEKNWNNRQ